MFNLFTLNKNTNSKEDSLSFPSPIIISEKQFCAKCGYNHFKDGKCIKCGCSKIRRI